MQKTPSASRAKRVLRLLAIFLVLTIAVSVFVPLFKNKTSTNSIVPIPPTLNPAPTPEYGGVNLISSDFTTEDDYNTVFNFNWKSVYTELTDGRLCISSDVSGDEYHTNYYSVSKDMEFDFSSAEYITLDYDIELYLNDSISAGLRFLDENSKGISGVGGYTSLLYFTPIINGNGYTVDVNQGGTLTLATIDNSCHVTIVYRFDHSNYRNSVALVYIDGSYVGQMKKFAITDIAKLGGFRIHQTTSNNKNFPDYIYLDNYSVNAFANGYDGALTMLFENSEYKLQDCSDSLLFEG